MRGFWHDFTISTDENFIKLEITTGLNPHNITDHYVWSYDNGIWRDALYNDVYILITECVKSTDSIQFRLGVDTMAVPGTWTLTVSDINGAILTDTITVASSVREYSLSAPDYFIIGIENFTEWIAPSSNQYFRLQNTGNVPLGNVEFTFTDQNGQDRDDNFQYTNDTEVLDIGVETIHYISFKTDPSLQARDVLMVDCIVKATTIHVIPTTSSQILEGILAHQFKITVYMKKTAADLVDVSNFLIYEYKNTMDIRAGEESEHELYITALKDTSLMIGVTSPNIEITEILYQDEIQTPPVNFSMSAGEKVRFAVKVISYEENSTAKIIYGITPGSSQTEILEINLNVGAKVQTFTQTALITMALLVVVAVICLALFSVFRKHRSMKPKEKKERRGRN